MKCSFCKLNWSEHNLIPYRKNNYPNSKVKHICKLCNEKHDILQYKTQSTARLVASQEKYNFKKENGVEIPNELMEQIINKHKLRLEIKNGK